MIESIGMPKKPFLRFLLNLLRGPAPGCGSSLSTSRTTVALDSYFIVRAFYIINLAIVFDFIVRIAKYKTRDLPLQPIWPVYWVKLFEAEHVVFFISCILIFSSILAVWRFDYRFPRILVFLSLLIFTAYVNSFGSANHYSYFPLWVSFIFIFAPGHGVKFQDLPLNRQYMYAMVVFSAQALIGLFYTMSGFFKAQAGVFPPDGVVSSFDPSALPRMVIGRWAETGSVSVFSEFFVANIGASWPIYLMVIYLELFFFVAVFRPQLHRLFGLCITVFHFGVWLVMAVPFRFQPVIVALLFIFSPSAQRGQYSVIEVLRQLPLANLIFLLSGKPWKGKVSRVG